MVDQKMNHSSDENFEFEKAMKACRPSPQKQSVGEIMFLAGRAAEREERLVQVKMASPSAKPSILRWQIATAASLLVSVACLGALALQSTTPITPTTETMANSPSPEDVAPSGLANAEGQLPTPATDGSKAIVKPSNQFVPAIWRPISTDLYSPLGRRSRMIKLAAQATFVDFESLSSRKSKPPALMTARELIQQYSNDENL